MKSNALPSGFATGRPPAVDPQPVVSLVPDAQSVAANDRSTAAGLPMPSQTWFGRTLERLRRMSELQAQVVAITLASALLFILVQTLTATMKF